MTLKRLFLSSEEVKEGGQALLSGSGTWTVPNGVTSISVLGIEKGNTGFSGNNFVLGSGATGGGGGLGGRRRYINNVPVSPGQQIPYSITAGGFVFGDILSGTAGGVDAGRAGQGGAGGNSASNQTSFGLGGAAGSPVSYIDAEVDYPFLPTTAQTSTAVAGLYPGGGGGGGHGGINIQGQTTGNPGAVGGDGVISILWPGDGRAFPNTRTAPEAPNDVIYDPRGLSTQLSKFATDGAGTWIGIDTSAVVGRRGRIFRSTDNGRSFTYHSTPYDAQLAGVAFGAGVFLVMIATPIATDVYGVLRSADSGQTWALANISQSLGANQADIAFRNGRFFAINGRNTSSGNKYMTSDNLGVTWTNRTLLGGTQVVVIQQTRFIPVSNTLLIIRRGGETDTFLSRDNGLTYQTTTYMDAAKLGSVTLGLVAGTGSQPIRISSDELVNASNVAGITLTAPESQRFLVSLADRILILDGATTYQYKDGAFTTTSRLPVGLAYNGLTSQFFQNPGLRYATDGIDAVISIVKDGNSANFRSSVYVS